MQFERLFPIVLLEDSSRVAKTNKLMQDELTCAQQPHFVLGFLDKSFDAEFHVLHDNP